MAKVRVVMAEMEGSDDAVRSAISTFAERMGVGETRPALTGIAAAPAAVAVPKLIDQPAQPKKSRKGGRRAVRAAETSPAPAATQVADPKPDTDPLRKQIVSLLGAKPMTSLELIEATKAKPADMYYRLGDMRKKGQITTEVIDYERKNVLVK